MTCFFNHHTSYWKM